MAAKHKSYEPVSENGLTPADELFVHAWMSNGFKVIEAYLATYPKVSRITASKNGKAKLKEPLVAAYTCGVLRTHLDKYEVTESNIISELANIAFFDIKDVVTKDGSVINNVNDMTEKARRCIGSITAGHDGKTTIKICDKEKALELLAKYLKLLTDVHQFKDSDDLMVAIKEARKQRQDSIPINELEAIL